jgi:Fe-S cluster biogenesis protein NfuA
MDSREALDQSIERLQQLLAGLDGVTDAATRNCLRELVQVVLDLHRRGLSDLLDIVSETGDQPADTLLPRFLINPVVRGLLLLHDLHPENLQTRVQEAVERLRPHLGMHGLRVELDSLDQDRVRLHVTVAPHGGRRPDAATARREIETTVLDFAPDAASIEIDGLEVLDAPRESLVPVSAIAGRKQTGSHAGALVK